MYRVASATLCDPQTNKAKIATALASLLRACFNRIVFMVSSLNLHNRWHLNMDCILISNAGCHDEFQSGYRHSTCRSTSCLAGNRIQTYEQKADGVFETVFNGLAVTVNTSDSAPYLLADVLVAPHGYVLRTVDGQLYAGIVRTTWRGQPLPAGDHHLSRWKKGQN